MYDWYVDSVNGSDSNDGKTERTPLQTIAALEAKTISPGDVIALARGSHWREQLDITAANVTVLAYGSGARPILDGSDIALNASFSKTAGRTNVYEISITPEWNGSGKDFVNVWEDDTILTRAASVANCDANAGSCYPSDEGAGTITLYVHATDSSDVTSNGAVYEYTKRKYGLDTRDATAPILCYLHTKRNLHVDGSLRIGPSGIATCIYCDDGSAHNVLFETGAVLDRVEAREAYYNSDFSMFVGNTNTPAGEGLTLVNCAATLATYSASATGYYAHYNTSGTFGAVQFIGCTATNLAVAFSATHGDSFTLRDCVTTGTKTFLRDTSTSPYTVSGGSYTYAGAAGRVFDGQAAGTRTITGMTITITDPADSIIYTAQNVTLTLTDNTFTNNAPASADSYFVHLSNASSILTSTGNAFNTPNLSDGPYVYLFENDLAALVSDENCFGHASQWFRKGAGNYGTVAQYQSATSQDGNSTVGDC
jgi:hypothetical protein